MVTQQELKVLNKSFKSAWASLSQTSQQQVIPTVFESKTMQFYFIEIYQLLYTKCGGDEVFMQHWFNTTNTTFGDLPISLCQTEAGLLKVKAYFESRLGR